MTDKLPEVYSDIDWDKLRNNALAQKGWQNKGPKEWDEKAISFAGRNKDSSYIDLFLSHLPLEKSLTVLDIGSGPGTLAIPIARQVRSVTALDFSPVMLNILNELAAKEGIVTIKTVHCAWEDDWQAKGIQPHDIAIASRAMGVKDLKSALQKIDAHATKYIFITDRIGATPFDIGAYEAIGRPFLAGPDYIFTINMLYHLGIHPNINILTIERDVNYSSMAEAIKSYSWMFHDITPAETLALEQYISRKIVFRCNDRLTVRRDNPPQWALIWWKKHIP